LKDDHRHIKKWSRIGSDHRFSENPFSSRVIIFLGAKMRMKHQVERGGRSESESDREDEKKSS